MLIVRRRKTHKTHISTFIQILLKIIMMKYNNVKKNFFTIQKNLTYFCYVVLKMECETIDEVEIMSAMKEMDPGYSEIEINI